MEENRVQETLIFKQKVTNMILILIDWASLAQYHHLCLYSIAGGRHMTGNENRKKCGMTCHEKSPAKRKLGMLQFTVDTLAPRTSGWPTGSLLISSAPQCLRFLPLPESGQKDGFTKSSGGSKPLRSF